MEEKKNKISLPTFLFVLALLVIIIMALFIYMQKVNAEKEVAALKNDADQLKATVTELQGKLENINEISSISTNEKDKDYFVLYYGCEMEIKTGEVLADTLDKNTANNKKYNTTYYNYENGKYVGETTGKVVENGIENRYVVDNVKKIAISKKFNAIPRSYTVINKLPDELMEMADCKSVDIHSIDLDGDGKEEKIVCYTVSEAKGDFENTEPIAKSEIILFDSNYKKIASLVKIDDGFAASERIEQSKVFLTLDDVDYIDIDNDGIMEIITRIPEYESEGQSNLSIVKYNKGKLEGKTDIIANVRP